MFISISIYIYICMYIYILCKNMGFCTKNYTEIYRYIENYENISNICKYRNIHNIYQI